MGFESIRREEHYAVVTVDERFESFAALRATLESLREDESLRAILLDLRDSGFAANDDPAALRHFVLPMVAAWAGELDSPRVLAGIFCDVRIGQQGQRLNWTPSMRGSGRARFAEVLGVAEADVMTALAEGMLSSGLVTQMPAGDPLPEAERIAGVIASRGPIATQLAKEAIWRGLQLPFENALRFETDLTLLLQTTNDRAEGVEAFLQKRPPRFTGT